MSGGVLAPVTTIYDCTGADQTYTVPWGVYWLKVELWGAAGAGYSATVTGGPGGYTTGLLAVTPGEVLTIIVGETGGVAVRTAQTAVKYGGGGIGGTYANPSQGWNAPGGGQYLAPSETHTIAVAVVAAGIVAAIMSSGTLPKRLVCLVSKTCLVTDAFSLRSAPKTKKTRASGPGLCP